MLVLLFFPLELRAQYYYYCVLRTTTIPGVLQLSCLLCCVIRLHCSNNNPFGIHPSMLCSAHIQKRRVSTRSLPQATTTHRGQKIRTAIFNTERPKGTYISVYCRVIRVHTTGRRACSTQFRHTDAHPIYTVPRPLELLRVQQKYTLVVADMYMHAVI